MPFGPATIGRYTVQRVLGRGGMGTVYLAVDPLIEREVAIKVLPAAGADAYEERLLAEARVSGRLIHPNIVGVFDIGDEQGQPFVVMPYIDGRTLASVLTDSVRPAMAVKLQWMIQLCDALAYAHERRVIHRDIKPANLLIDEQQNLRVLDFGIAKVLTTSQIQFTSVGTPAYMAPEQYSSAPVDPRTDIFSAGLVLYELITHRRALTGTTPAQIYGQLMAGPPPRVLDTAPETDPALAAVCERAMSRDPSDRFQTARAFGEALAEVHQRWLASTLIASTVAAKAAAPPPDVKAPAPDPAPTLATRIDGIPVAPPAAEPTAPPAAAAAPVRPAPTPLPPPAPARPAWAVPVLAVAAIVAMFGVFWVSRVEPEVPSTTSAADSPASPSPTPLDIPAPQSAPTGQRTEPVTAAPLAAPSTGRVRVTSDLEGATFWLRSAAERTAKPIASNQTVAPGRYEIGADYIDKDPLLGEPIGGPITASETIDVAAGRTATVAIEMESLLWRRRFVRALQKPAAQGRAALLDRSYRRLDEMGALDASDTARYQRAASEQQLVEFVTGRLTADSGGFERYVTYKKVEIVRIDAAAQRIAVRGTASASYELTRGRHEFAAVVDVQYASGPQSLSCSGAFDVDGGPSTLELKVDAIVRRPPKGDGKLAVECQIGVPTPFVPAPPRSTGPISATLTVHVQSYATPVAGTRIAVIAGPIPYPATQVTDATGTVTFSGLPAGDYGLEITPIGVSRFGQVVYVSGSPVDAFVQLAPWAARTTTNTDGSFSLSLKPGRYDVLVQRAGFLSTWFEGVALTASRSAWLEATIPRGSLRDVVKATDRGLDDSRVQLSGLFRDSRGAPLAGASATAFQAR
jgi:Protein kinase domain/Carboxypeptidase regulatory-like domain